MLGGRGVPIAGVQYQRTARDLLKDRTDLRPGQEDFDKPLGPSYQGGFLFFVFFQKDSPRVWFHFPVLNQESCE